MCPHPTTLCGQDRMDLVHAGERVAKPQMCPAVSENPSQRRPLRGAFKHQPRFALLVRARRTQHLNPRSGACVNEYGEIFAFFFPTLPPRHAVRKHP